jgi:hypothetical protein
MYRLDATQKYETRDRFASWSWGHHIFFDNQRTHELFINWILKLVVGCSNLPEGTKLHKDTRMAIPACHNERAWNVIKHMTVYESKYSRLFIFSEMTATA